jgi:hypothetical protein
MQFEDLAVVVVVKPDEPGPFDIILEPVEEGSLEIGLQRESEFSFQESAT